MPRRSGYATAFVVLFALFFGAGNGLSTLIRSTLIADRFGLARYGTVSGQVAACGQVARAAGPLLAAWAATRAGRYEPVWWASAAAVALGAFLLRGLNLATSVAPSTVEGLGHDGRVNSR